MDKEEEHSFQAEINDLMNLMINTLYVNKSSFMRELISNASDAIDKDRQDRLSRDVSGKSDYCIQVSPDTDSRTLTIRDNGIGMSKADLITNLGTIAKSGTKDFIKKLTSSSETKMNMIGNFGVGFYSSFMIANKVEVISSKDGLKTSWVSEADGKFTTKELGSSVESGTEVRLHIKESECEILGQDVLRSLVQHHSSYISYPIEMQIESESSSESKAKFERINHDTRLWQRSPNDISTEEYSEFYKQFTGDPHEPLAVKHFSIEGEVDFKCLMYISKAAPVNLFEINRDILRNVVLFSKGVFVTSESTVMSPPWMIYTTCIVDCENAPLNVGREFLKDKRTADIIRKTISKRALAMVSDLDTKDAEIFHMNYSKCLKYGVLHDSPDKDALLKVMKFVSSKCDGLISLEEYCKSMPEDQKHILYCCGPDLLDMRHSEVVEHLAARGKGVILLDDTIDEALMSKLEYVYEGKTLSCMNINSEDFCIEAKSEIEEVDDGFDDLADKLKKLFGDEIVKVTQTDKGRNPLCIRVPRKGISGFHESIIARQQHIPALQSKARSKKVLEINVKHPIIISLKEKLSVDKDFDDAQKSLLVALYSTALLHGGYLMQGTIAYANNVFEMIAKLSGN